MTLVQLSSIPSRGPGITIPIIQNFQLGQVRSLKDMVGMETAEPQLLQNTVAENLIGYVGGNILSVCHISYVICFSVGFHLISGC